jgi:hypothetical protein
LFDLPGRILCNNPLDVKENYEHALEFSFNLPRLFRSRWIWTFRVRLIISCPNLCPIIAGVSVATFSEICTTFDAYSPSLCRIHREIAIRYA